MSKAAPVNAWISSENREGRRVVVKTYRLGARYSAREENMAYEALSKLAAGLKGVRTAEVIDVNKPENQIIVEFIDLPTLQEEVRRGNISLLQATRSRLIKLFHLSSGSGLKFDADPTNIFVDEDEIILIDPVCTDLALNDYAFVVFAWGIVKIVLRNWRIWLAPSLLKELRAFIRDYTRMSDRTVKDINRQIVSYIGLVIEWNRERNSVESAAVYWFRQIVVIPVYRAVQIAFGQPLFALGRGDKHKSL